MMQTRVTGLLGPFLKTNVAGEASKSLFHRFLFGARIFEIMAHVQGINFKREKPSQFTYSKRNE